MRLFPHCLNKQNWPYLNQSQFSTHHGSFYGGRGSHGDSDPQPQQCRLVVVVIILAVLSVRRFHAPASVVGANAAFHWDGRRFFCQHQRGATITATPAAVANVASTHRDSGASAPTMGACVRLCVCAFGWLTYHVKRCKKRERERQRESSCADTFYASLIFYFVCVCAASPTY